jgi:hypothetical protein
VNIYCDNYSTCNEVMFDRGSEVATKTRARAGGWHIFDGTTIGGAEHHATLGPVCAGMRRRALDPAPPLQPGQIELFEIVAYTDKEPS